MEKLTFGQVARLEFVQRVEYIDSLNEKEKQELLLTITPEEQIILDTKKFEVINENK